MSLDAVFFCAARTLEKSGGSGQRFSKSSLDSPEELDNSLVAVLTRVSRVALLLRH